MAVKLVGKDIADVDVKDLLKKLTTAFADEWSAYYQYWLGAQIAKGVMRPAIVAELVQHAGEELAHAQMITDRIIQLGGVVKMLPSEWEKFAGCKYNAVKSESSKIILQENIKGEQCAIKFYNSLLNDVYGKDFVTANIISKILEDEVTHEQDLVMLLEDLENCCK
ncbi:MAG: ferritin-like domain-containing protein [Candidatus Babeliales bacterium]|jgi:bacterioferritin